jgi:hypothetical protein
MSAESTGMQVASIISIVCCGGIFLSYIYFPKVKKQNYSSIILYIALSDFLGAIGD